MKKSDFYFYLLCQAKVSTRLFWPLQKQLGSSQKIVEAGLSDSPLLTPKVCQEIQKVWASKTTHQNNFEKLANHFTILDDEYPELLKKIYDPPLLLFYAGDLQLLTSEYLVSMVGSRHTTHYHQASADKIISELAGSPLVIVSGLAIGLDTACHQAALKNNLATIAVLGSGLDQASFYPKVNFKLAQEIIQKGGLILSEYPIGTKPALHQFPRRNRILAGLSRATVVISGALKSGTLITAQVALDEGREVFALPGNINQQLCQGPNSLLQNGANIITSGQDILDYYQLKPQQQLKIKTLDLTANEKIIVELLKIEPLNLESLLYKTKWSLPLLQSTLSSLEIKNIVQTEHDGLVSLKW
jgi:DNA processing protein